MTKIIDLGNGYGRVEGYKSNYASLTFPFQPSNLSKLYVKGWISRDEFQQALLYLGYGEQEAAWKVAVASVTVEQWKAGLNGLRSV